MGYFSTFNIARSTRVVSLGLERKESVEVHPVLAHIFRRHLNGFTQFVWKQR